MPIATSNPLVEAGFIHATKFGAAIPLVNWAGAPVRGLQVTLNFALPPQIDPAKATLAKGGNVTVTTARRGRRGGAGVTFTVERLEVGDAIVLRV